MVERGEADAMICGLVGRFHKKLGYLRSVFDFDPGVTGTVGDDRRDQRPGRVVLPRHARAVRPDRRADRRSDAAGDATACKLFGIEPKVALLSHSNFGSHDNAVGARRCARCCEIIKAARAQARDRRRDAWPTPRGTRSCASASSRTPRCKGRANLFVLPNLDAANITYNMVRVMTDGVGDRPDPDGPGQAGAHPDAGLRRRAAWST